MILTLEEGKREGQGVDTKFFIKRIIESYNFEEKKLSSN